MKDLACVSFILFLTLAVTAQSAPQSKARPAAHFTGELAAINGSRQLTLKGKQDSKPKNFVGTIQSTCRLRPPGAGHGEPFDLSTIPIGTLMTVFYVRHAQHGKDPENVILAMRLDRIRKKISTLPQSIMLPCVSAGN